MKLKLFAFWPYDQFPHCLGAEIKDMDPDTVFLLGYGFKNRTDSVVITPYNTGMKINTELELLKNEYDKAIKDVNDLYKMRVKAVFKLNKVAQPLL